MGWVSKNIRIGSVAGLLLMMMAVWNVASFQTQSTYQADRAATQYGQLTDDRIAQNCAEAEASSAPQCLAEQIRATREDQRGEYDLAAQERMAAWALWSMVFAGATTALSGIAVALLKGTLDATRQTVDAVTTSNETAANMAIEARRANDIAENATRAQSRAYVSTTEARIIWRGANTPRIEIRVFNGGLTPASAIIIYTSKIARLTSTQENLSVVANIRKRCHYLVGNAGDWFPICPEEEDVKAKSISSALLECLTDNLRVGVSGEIRFKTLFDGEGSAPFLFKVDADDTDEVQFMDVMPPPCEGFSFKPLATNESIPNSDSDGEGQEGN